MRGGGRLCVVFEEAMKDGGKRRGEKKEKKEKKKEEKTGEKESGRVESRKERSGGTLEIQVERRYRSPPRNFDWLTCALRRAIRPVPREMRHLISKPGALRFHDPGQVNNGIHISDIHSIHNLRNARAYRTNATIDHSPTPL